ncbi:MAG: SH3 domain-containing protein [Pseudomonadota bacterium]
MRSWILVAVFLLALPQTSMAAEPQVEPRYEPAMVMRESNFRADPSTGQPPLDTFKAGTKVLITGVTKDARGRDWYAVSLYDGRRGYIYGRLVAALPTPPDPPEGLGVTKVSDPAVAAEVVGSHGMTMQRIGSDPWGGLSVFEDLGLYYARGSQPGSQGDRMVLDGTLLAIDSRGFTLQGDLSYGARENGQRITCKRNAKLRFDLVANSNTWRYSGPAGSCGPWSEQIEVYRRKE